MCKKNEPDDGANLRGWRYAAFLLYRLDEARKKGGIVSAVPALEALNSESPKRLLSSRGPRDTKKNHNGSEG